MKITIPKVFLAWAALSLVAFPPVTAEARSGGGHSSPHSGGGSHKGGHTTPHSGGSHGGSHTRGSHASPVHHATGSHTHARGASPSSSHNKNYANGAQRDSHGRIERSSAARHEFMKETGYPNGRPGYVIDHVQALKHGGADAPSNMQWQTKAEAKAKDRWE